MESEPPPHFARQTSAKKPKARHSSSTSNLGFEVRSTNGKQRGISFDFFKEAPLDILGEVCRLVHLQIDAAGDAELTGLIPSEKVLSYLSPLDLLRLSRTTKALRRYLMSKTSSTIWKSSLAVIEGLPPCPEDLSEPQYVNLMFWGHCHVCFVEGHKLFKYMEARVQLCSPCGVNAFLPWEHLPGVIDERLKSLIPSIGEDLCTHEREVGYVVCDSYERKSKRKRDTPPTSFFHITTAVQLNKELEALGTEKLKKARVEDRSIAWKKIKEHSEACREYMTWLTDQERERVARARSRRKEQLREKLAALGWEHEFDTMGIANPRVPNAELCYYAHLQRAEELTDQVWEQTKDDWVIFMQGVRGIHEKNARCRQFKTRIKTHIEPAYSQYVLSQPANAVVPTLAEVVRMEEFLSVAASPPFDHDLPDGAFDDAIAHLPELVAKWQSAREEVAIQVLRSSPVYASGEEVPEGVLSHASSVFSCKNCSRNLSCPSLFVHECFLRSVQVPTRRVSKKSKTKEEKEGGNVASFAPEGTLSQEALDDMIQNAFPNVRSWQPSPFLVFDGPGYHHTVAVLDLLGLKRTTTAEELRKLNPTLECRCECFGGGKDRVMSWLDALKYCKRHRSHSYEGSFAIVHGKVAARRQIAKSMDICSWCQMKRTDWRVGSTQGAVEHYMEEHQCTQAEAQAFENRALKEEMVD